MCQGYKTLDLLPLLQAKATSSKGQRALDTKLALQPCIAKSIRHSTLSNNALLWLNLLDHWYQVYGKPR